jgi:hypothetical protein
MQDKTERWMELCKQAAVEQDPKKLIALRKLTTCCKLKNGDSVSFLLIPRNPEFDAALRGAVLAR